MKQNRWKFISLLSSTFGDGPVVIPQFLEYEDSTPGDQTPAGGNA